MGCAPRTVRRTSEVCGRRRTQKCAANIAVGQDQPQWLGGQCRLPGRGLKPHLVKLICSGGSRKHRQSIAKRKSSHKDSIIEDIIIDGKRYYHPFPEKNLKETSSVWKVFRRDIYFSVPNRVTCTKCSKKSTEGKLILHSETWVQGATTQPMLRHLRKLHSELLVDKQSPAKKVGQPPTLFKEM